MTVTEHRSELDRRVRELVTEEFTPHFDQLEDEFSSHPLWRRATELGGEVWLDSGDMEAIGRNWTREFSALTTNNTLLNREVQKGTYDELIVRAAELLDQFPDLTERDRKLEMAFILNARHGLRLVEEFDVHVSVEEHTDLARDVEGAVRYARRFYAVCPERFYVKIPFTPEGLVATRRVSEEGIPVNHTLGFAARQNYVITRLARPAFCNVFMGRLNSFVADNGLGRGELVGEKALLASQRIVRELRRERGLETRQIGASFREGGQVELLVGLDVMTLPPKVAEGFLGLGLDPDDLADRTGEHYEPALKEGLDPAEVRLETLWEVGDRLKGCVDELAERDFPSFTGPQVVEFFQERGCGDVFPRWTDEQVQTSAEEGKIPVLENWADLLSSGRIGLDALMNLAGYNHFNNDQVEMDEHVREVLE